MATSFLKLNIAVIGGGLGGLSAAISLRRAGHIVTIYERRDFAGEIGAGIGIPSNGSKWLYKWGVDIEAGRPVVMSKLLIHKVGDRCDLHLILLDAAISRDGLGTPCILVTNHRAVSVDATKGQVIFENGNAMTADLVIGADGIHSQLREAIGIVSEVQQASSCAYRHIIPKDKVNDLGFEEIGSQNAIEFWNGPDGSKIVTRSCNGGEVLGIYAFFPPDSLSDGWNISISPQDLVTTFPDLDLRIRTIMLHSEDIKIWRLYVHKPYQYWTRGRVALLGDAAHPMLPDQTQGHSQAIEDAAALGLVFSEQYFHADAKKGIDHAVELALQRYENVRMSRATAVQSASPKAREDLRERIGWEAEGVKPGTMTIEDVCGYDMEKHLSEIMSRF